MYSQLGAVQTLAIDATRADYLAWVSSVSSSGGVVVNFPAHGVTVTIVGLGPADAYGLPAARYPVDALLSEPDAWSADNMFGYFIAPAGVIQYALSNGLLGSGITTPQAVPGEPAPANPDWYEHLLTVLKVGGWIAGGLAAMELLSFLPRRR